MSEKEQDKIKEVKKDAAAQKVFDEVKSGKRIVEIEGHGEVELRFPTGEDTRVADWKYSKTYMDAINEGLPLQEEVLKMLKNKSIWTEEQEEEVTKLREKIGSLEVILGKRDEEDKSKATKKIATELLNKRNELYALQGKKQSYLLHAVETKAEEVKTQYLLCRCAFKDGKRLWEKTEELDNENRYDLVARVSIEFSTFQLGLTSDFFENLPESKYIEV